MALGYQRIHDLSPLSMKLLNDQLEQLWKKIMGGMDARDFTQKTQNILNNAVTSDRFSSMIEQYADEIKLTVGSSGADNLIRNGNALFGTDGWAFSQSQCKKVSDEARGDVFSLDRPGTMSQGSIALKAGTTYTLGFYYICYEGIKASVGEIAEGDYRIASEWEEYTVTFTPETAGSYAAAIQVRGAARISDIMLCEGLSATYRQNPNEIHNASLSVTDDRVVIDTENFALRLRNDQGDVVTEMTADSQGFNQLYIANDLFLRGKSLYLGQGRYDLWVHPNASSTGERTFFFSGSSAPPTLEGMFPDIQEAIDFIPKWCEGDVYIHVYGAGAWQYPSYKLEIANFFGGGSIWILGWGNDYTIKRMEIRNNKLVTEVRDANINSCGSSDCFFVSNAVANFAACGINGRGVLLGTTSAGYVASDGAQVTLSSCEAHNCSIGGMAMNNGHLTVVSCQGSGNSTGVFAKIGGIVSTANSIWQAGSMSAEVSGGKVLVTTTSTSAGAPPAATPMEYYAHFVASQTASVYGGTWTTSPDLLSMLKYNDAVMWFDMAEFAAALSGKTIVAASLTLRRRGSGGRATAVPVTMHGARSEGPSGIALTARSYGTIGAWTWGEKRTVSIPVSAITDLRADTIKGFMLRSEEDIVFVGLSGSVHESLPRLEVVYR